MARSNVSQTEAQTRRFLALLPGAKNRGLCGRLRAFQEDTGKSPQGVGKGGLVQPLCAGGEGRQREAQGHMAEPGLNLPLLGLAGAAPPSEGSAPHARSSAPR